MLHGSTITTRNCNETKPMADLDYYAMYLKNHLKGEDDPRQDNDEFITGRADAAAEEYERARRAGYTVDGAQELAMAKLLDGLSSMPSTEEIVSILQDYKPMAQAKYGITRFGLFGSVARGEQREDSDVDVCFEGGSPTLLTIAKMEIELEKLMGRRVHVLMLHDGLPKKKNESISNDVIWTT